MRLRIQPQLLTGAVLLQELPGPASGVCPGAPCSLLHPNIWQHLLSKVTDPCQGCRASLRTSLGRGEPPPHCCSGLGEAGRLWRGPILGVPCSRGEDGLPRGSTETTLPRGLGPTLILARKFLGEDDLQESHPTSPFCPKIIKLWP